MCIRDRFGGAGQSNNLFQPTSSDERKLLSDGTTCRWPGCSWKSSSHEELTFHLNTEHTLNPKTQLQIKMQGMFIDHLESLVSHEKDKIQAMKKHLNISLSDIDESLAKYDVLTSSITTPPTPSSTSSSTSSTSTSNSGPKSKPATPIGGQTNNPQVLQAVYTDTNGQPVYITVSYTHLTLPTKA